MASLEHIRVVLVRPIYGGNVGSVCRAMANMGLARLCLVAPRPLDWVQARKMACAARGVLECRCEYSTLADAVGDCALVVGASGRGGLYRQHAKTPREWAPRILAAAEEQEVALVFGPEDNGLSNEDLALCTQIMQIPTTAEYRSLNLAQAVLVCGYELFSISGQFDSPEEKSPEASSSFRERMFEIWRAALLEIGFMEADKEQHMMLGLRRVLSRGPLTEDDVRILMGIARQAQWCARELRRVQR